MKNFLILLPVTLVLALLQGTFLPLNLLLLLVILVAVVKLGKVSSFLAFWSGFLLDLASGTPLGLSSFLFLIFSFVLFLYRHRLDLNHPFLLLFFVFFFAMFFNRIVYYHWNWLQGLVLVVLVYAARPLMKYFQDFKGGVRLKI